MRRAALALTALLVVGADRISKELVSGLLATGSPVDLFGGSLRLIRSENRGGLFGLFQGSAPLLALLSMAVIVLLVLMHAREGGTRPSLLTLSTGLLVGGALGNLVDRLANGFVFDFIDIGIGSTRFWTFNVADMAITSGIALLVAQAAFGGVRNRVRAPHG
jgi:signal peptidase II